MIFNFIFLYVLVFISMFCLNLSKIVAHTKAQEKYRSRDLLRATDVLVKEYRSRILWSPAWPIRVVLDLAYLLKHSRQLH